ncbi:MAG TPA: FtsX-like permease family protein [Steroidobacteraceae bacterium]|nr:FtsX-like permease family protein [Steroidobacteraceae bacterium]
MSEQVLGRLSPLLLQAGIIGPLRAAPGRTALAIVAIALGVALGLAIHLINRTAADEVALASRSLFGLADFSVTGTSRGFGEALYPEVARVPGVALVSPVVEVEARLFEQRGTLIVLGIDPFRAFRLLPPLGFGPRGSDGPVMSGRVLFLSPAAARRLGLDEGDSLTLQVGLEPVTFEIGGLLPSTAYPQPVAIGDIADVQWLFDRLGRLNRLDLRLEPGADRSAVRDAIAELLPAGVAVTTPGQETDEALRLSRAYRANLTALALVALFTGAFLVYATQSLSVVRRRRELALLHALGLTDREQIALTLTGGAIVGSLGAVLGVVLGVLVARIGLQTFGTDLGAGYFRGIAPELAVHPGEIVVFFLLGLLVALGGTLRPAIQAANVPAAGALKSGDILPGAERVRHWPGVVLLLFAAGCLLLPPIAGLPLPGYAAIALVLIGAVALMPALTRRLVASLPERGPPPWQVAMAHLRGTAPQITVSIAAVLVSFSLMAAMAIMVASFRGSLADWLDKVLPADVYVRVGYTGESAWLDQPTLAAIRDIPGVARLEANRFQDVLLGNGSGPVTVIARPITERGADDILWLENRADDRIPEGLLPAWVSESAADLYQLAPDETFDLVFDGQTSGFSVRGVWRDYERPAGAIVLDLDTYQSLSGDDRVNTAWVWLEPGASLDEVVQAVRARLPAEGAFDVALPGEIRALSLRIFDRTFAVTYLLEAVAVLIGLIGISSSMSAQVLARRAEFAMLRHVGFTRGQVGTMLGIEGAGLGAVGVAAGLIVGAVVSLILIYVVNRQSFHWSMDVHVPWLALGLLSAALIGAAAITAVVSGRQAMAGETARAVREDW